MTNSRDSYRNLLLQASVEVAAHPQEPQRLTAPDPQPSRPLFGFDSIRYRLHLQRMYKLLQHGRH
jgi:hypothetical protein